ncbi:MAG: ferritin [Nitrospinota bacterium]|nr:MAG: ferritin [Nitrospinota bacterium]
MEQAINAQIGREFAAALQYVSVATHFDADVLPQLAGFFYRQAEEEKEHAMKLVHYLVETGAQVQIPGIEQPKHQFASVEEAVKLALDWEVEVTKQINDLMDLAVKQNDHLTQNFLRWFVEEQLEEVTTMQALLRTVQRAGENLLLVEAALAQQKPGE